MSESTVKDKAIYNTKIAIFTQMLSVIFGVIKSILVPLIVSVEAFGYWQIYLLYLPYIGIFYWGFNDGIYLKYGNYDYKDIPYNKFRRAIKIFMVMLILETIITILISMGIEDINKRIAIICVLINIPIKGIYGTLIYVFQITNNIKSYCIYSLIDKVIFVILLALIFVTQENTFIWLIMADLLSSLVVTILMIRKNKELFIGKKDDLKNGIREFIDNIRNGISLMLASFMSLLLSNIGRIFVERFNDIQSYSYYSFGMTVINLLLVCFSSISTVMYPMLKRMDENNYGNQYNSLNRYFDIMAYTGLFAYFVAYIMIPLVFPNYISVLDYLHILFVLVIFQGKINLLNTTYYKVLREEKRMMWENIFSILLFLCLCIIAKDVKSVAIITLLVMAQRCIDSELFLRSKMNIRKDNKIFRLLLIATLYIIGIEINFIVGTIIYTIIYIVYVLINKDDLYKFIKLVLNNKIKLREENK